MPSKLATHWQRTHPDDGRDRAIFARWKPLSVKIITDSDDVKGIELIPLESIVIVRHYGMSENWHQRGIMDKAHAKNMGATHAAKCKQLADWIHANVPARDLHTVVFTGLNEPEVWDREPPELTAVYSVALLNDLHGFGLHGGALSLGVGHPTNGGVPDAPPIWTPYAPVRDALRPGDFLVKHGYWSHDGPEKDFKWYAGDWTQCPFSVPIIIGECGLDEYVIDNSVPASKRGWRGWLAPQDYMNQLVWYDMQLRADSRVHSAQVFTFDYAHPWSSFDIRKADFMESLFLPYIESQANTSNSPPIWGDASITPWRALCEKYGAQHGIDARVLGGIIKIESGGRPDARGAYSPVGEVGLMQIIPGENPGFEGRPGVAALLAPETNIKTGAAILAGSIAYLGGDVRRGLMGYNAGTGWVSSHPDAQDTSVHYVAKFTVAWGDLWPGAALPWESVPPSLVWPTTEEVGNFVRALLFPAGPIARNTDSAFFKQAQTYGLGMPLMHEADYGAFRIQAHALGTVVCPVGQWANVRVYPAP